MNRRPPLLASFCTALLSGLALPALAQTTTGLVGGTDPSLVLLVWDSANKVAYTRDTGLTGTSLLGSLSDSGQQKFWTLDPATDTNFAQFLKSSPNLANDTWMVIGGGNGSTVKKAGNFVAFSTMQNTVLVNNQPTLNQNWPQLIGVTNGPFASFSALFNTALYTTLNGGGVGTFASAFNNYATAPAGTGSSFEVKGTPSASYPFDYSSGSVFSDINNIADGENILVNGAVGNGQGVDVGNVLGTSGSSSWFYYMTLSNTDPKKPLPTSPITVQAFANSAQLAYWGLARTTNATNQQELVLSFTLPAAVTPTVTTAGVVRRNGTDFVASYGSARLIALADTPVSAANLVGGASVSAVPEPASVLLMAGGLAGVLAAARRQRRRSH